MSKNGKLKKARNVEKRRLQMQEAMDIFPLKQGDPEEAVAVLKIEPKQCSYDHCRRYVDPSCTECPYCGNFL